MTKEEAINILTSDKDGTFLGMSQEEYEAFNLAIKALEKQEKYRWHDLRKNTEDLPEENPRNTYDNDVLLLVENLTHPEDKAEIYKGHLKSRESYSEKRTDGKDNFWGMPTYDVNWTIWGWTYFNEPRVIAWREIEPFEEEENDDYI